MNNDKISLHSHSENITSMLGEKVMNEMVTLLFDYSGLVKRVEKLEKERAEHLDDTKQKTVRKTYKDKYLDSYISRNNSNRTFVISNI